MCRGPVPSLAALSSTRPYSGHGSPWPIFLLHILPKRHYKQKKFKVRGGHGLRGGRELPARPLKASGPHVCSGDPAASRYGWPPPPPPQCPTHRRRDPAATRLHLVLQRT